MLLGTAAVLSKPTITDNSFTLIPIELMIFKNKSTYAQTTQTKSMALESSYIKASQIMQDARKSFSDIGPHSPISIEGTQRLSVLESRLELAKLSAGGISQTSPNADSSRKMKIVRRFRNSLATDQIESLIQDIKKLGDSASEISRMSTIRRKPIQVLYDFYLTHNLPPESSEKLLDRETQLILQEPDDEITIEITEIIPWSDMHSAKYENTGPLVLNLVVKAINFVIFSQRFPKRGREEVTLPQLGSFICYLVIKICCHMRDRPDDSEFHIRIIYTVDSIINRLKSLTRLGSSNFNDLYLFLSMETCLRELENGLLELSESRLQLVDAQEHQYPPELEDDKAQIKLLLNDEEKIYPKYNLTFENLENIIFQELKIPVQIINNVDLEIFQTSGSYGNIFGGVYNNQKVAVKYLKENKLPDWHQCLRFIREVHIWNRADGGPYIQRFLGICKLEENRLGMVSPWCDNGNMFEYLSGRNIQVSLRLASQVSIGLEFLHSLGIVHGDLRSDNVLVWNGEARLADFGISHILSDTDGFTTETHGHEAWLAPELLVTEKKRGKPTYSSDVFSFGRLLFSSLTGKHPYGNRSRTKIYEMFLSNPPKQPTDFEEIKGPHSKDCLKLMHYCWVSKAILRPPAGYVRIKMSEIVQATQNVTLGHVEPLESVDTSSISM